MKNKVIINVLITICALVFSLFLFEIVASKIFGIPSFDDLELRYKINGVKTFAPGFYKKSNNFPIEGKKNIDIIYEDMFSYPFPSRVETDSLGYRNPEDNIKNAKTVIVGDSLVFGYGLPNTETMSSILESESESGEKFYNLSVSGWGPASYMKAVSDYSKYNAFDNLIIMYSLSNDDYNLDNSCWPELQVCKAPDDGPITRSDMLSYTIYAPPNILITSPLRHSSLVYVIFSFINGSPIQIFNKKYDVDSESPDDSSINQALNSLNDLAKGHCVSKEDEVEISKIKLFIINREFSDADRASYNLSKRLISQGCAPLILGDSFGRKIKRKMNLTFVSRYNISHLNKKNVTSEVLSSKEKKCKFQCNDLEKKQIFINWIKEASLKYNVSVFLVPAEYIIFLSSGPHWLCEYQSIEFDCVDLRDEIFNYYTQNEDALFHDGSHLNKLGTKFIVDKIRTTINK